jgi:hypothetical protein
MVVFMVAASRWLWAGLTRVFFDPRWALRGPDSNVDEGEDGGRTGPVGQKRAFSLNNWVPGSCRSASVLRLTHEESPDRRT